MALLMLAAEGERRLFGKTSARSSGGKTSITKHHCPDGEVSEIREVERATPRVQFNVVQSNGATERAPGTRMESFASHNRTEKQGILV